MQTGVYFDEGRGGRWFQDHGGGIRDFLVEKGFEEVGAASIRDWMKNAINSATEETAIVFAIDEVPREICRADSANVLIRKYLNGGGRVVWVGDVPFWSINEQRNGSQEKWGVGLPQQILGVYPLMVEQSEAVEFTEIGEQLLNERWYGDRPIAVSDGNRDKTLPFNLVSKIPYFSSEMTNRNKD